MCDLFGRPPGGNPSIGNPSVDNSNYVSRHQMEMFAVSANLTRQSVIVATRTIDQQTTFSNCNGESESYRKPPERYREYC